MMKADVRAWMLSALVASGAIFANVTCTKSSSAASPKSWHATGTIKSFGPDRSYANIAHDAIAGYMAAMTMSFEAQKKSQFDGLVEGDHVAFDFSETQDGKRVIAFIEKQK